MAALATDTSVGAPGARSGIPPILWPCGAILVGCALGPSRHAAWPILLILGIAAALLAVLARAGSLLIVPAVLLGLAVGLWRDVPPADHMVVWPTEPTNAVRGTVQQWPLAHGEMVQAPLAVFAARTERGWQPADVTLRATLPAYPPLQRGDVVVVGGAATIRRGWWQGTDGTVFGQWMRIEAEGDTATADDLRHRVIARFIAGIDRAVRSPEAGLTTGMLLGEKTVIDDRTRAALNATGTTQHVVISGWNIAIVIGLFGALGRWMGARRRFAWLALSLGAVALYTFAVGAEASVVRAAIMGAGGLLAPFVRRRSDPLVWLGIASAGMALRDPAVVRDLSFLLSCAATFGVLAIAPWLTEQAMRVTICRHFPRITEALALSVAASLMTEPIILHTFGRISIIGPVVNVIVEPLVPLIMALGFVTALATFLPLPFVASVLGLCTTLPAWLFLAIIRAASAFPVSAIAIPQPGLLITLLIYAVPTAVVVGMRMAPALARAPVFSGSRRDMFLILASFAVTLGIAFGLLTILR